MKKFQFIGLILLFLSACAPQPTPPPVATFTPSPTVQVMTPTAAPSATEEILVTQSAPATETPAAECKDSVSLASWMRDDVPYDFNDTGNNKPLPPSGRFTMAWTLQNTGTCTWDDSYRMAFKSGHIMTQAPGYPIVPAGQTVPPGQSAIVNISMVSPSKTGGYQAAWQLQNSKGESLMTFNVIIKVDRGSFSPPSHPIEPKYTYTCTAGIAKINLSWIDTANNEDGYRLYRGGIPLLELPAGTASYTDVVLGIGTYEYTIVAFNVAGEAPVNISAAVTTCQ
jgi:hypothetical protein